MAERSKAKQELREKIAKREAERYPYFKAWDYLEDVDKVPYLDDAESILVLIKQAGYKSPEEAEISFRAGQASDVELIRDTYNKGYEKGRLAGIKEIVEWINHNYWTGLGEYNIPLKDWLTKLKEWGL